jgi:hypothetical protein
MTLRDKILKNQNLNLLFRLKNRLNHPTQQLSGKKGVTLSLWSQIKSNNHLKLMIYELIQIVYHRNCKSNLKKLKNWKKF